MIFNVREIAAHNSINICLKLPDDPSSIYNLISSLFCSVVRGSNLAVYPQMIDYMINEIVGSAIDCRFSNPETFQVTVVFYDKHYAFSTYNPTLSQETYNYYKPRNNKSPIIVLVFMMHLIRSHSTISFNQLGNQTVVDSMLNKSFKPKNHTPYKIEFKGDSDCIPILIG